MELTKRTFNRLTCGLQITYGPELSWFKIFAKKLTIWSVCSFSGTAHCILEHFIDFDSYNEYPHPRPNKQKRTYFPLDSSHEDQDNSI